MWIRNRKLFSVNPSDSSVPLDPAGTNHIVPLHKQFTRGDRVLFVAALCLLGLLYWAYWGGGALSAQAAIYVEGRFWSKVDLYQAQQLEIKGKLGISRLQIEAGKIRFISSPCATQVCVHQGWIQVGGESVTCLPNGISVQVLSPDPRYDSINF